MRELGWHTVYREWKRLEIVSDSSFQAVCLFSLLGLVLTMLFLLKTSAN
jgi:hypothetical protein